MQRNPSTQLPGAGRRPHRQSGENRGRGSLGSNVEAASGSAQIQTPSNSQARTNGMVAGSHHFDLARSPPNSANKSITSSDTRCSQLIKLCCTGTKHVPCKFFKQGACQAGQACPFLHSNDATIETAPCKYFAKVC